ncbi:phenylacetic acid degradation-like protein [Sphingomonas sp. MM-1]|uniref:PaaI family thioesterase n=1 Tax=Sphingomonas sp. MM-1 TaxID=745310 RepID=UPI0002C12311|nr:PaaI family thioesterase [Sphingomonas sp. MM-1]AGH48469.1 phenylacetic acid degradation-like protein [Sphingomonas sp. MM-1]
MSLPPYADFLGLKLILDAEGPLLMMPNSDAVLGRPGFLHGGAISGLLEIAGIAALQASLGDGNTRVKPINVTVDFMRGGRLVDTYARGRVTRVGQRIANVAIEAWQDDPARPIAAARMNMSLDRAG